MWLLVQPPERGGLGMTPSEAEKLNVEQARFYLSDQGTVKKFCIRTRRLIRVAYGEPVASAEDVREGAAEYMARLREKYTGTRELK